MIAVYLDVVSYDEGLRIQQMIHAARVAGKGDDVLLLLEHEPVITSGRQGNKNDLLVPHEELEKRGIAFRQVSRGGKMTCHYPGQLVGYPIMRVETSQPDIPFLVYRLEETLIACLTKFDIQAGRIESLRGVWVDGRKIAAVGVEVREHVTMHGFSLNVFEDIGIYQFFVPCGIADRGIAFLEHFVNTGGRSIMNRLRDMIVRSFSLVFAVPVTARLSWEAFRHKFPEMIHEGMS